MKKVALSLIAFVAAGAFAFGQDAPVLKLSGNLNTGAQITVVDGETQTSQFESDSGKITRLRLNGAYENSDSGVKFRLEAVGSDAIAPNIAYAYVWSSFADKAVTVKVGALDDATFETEGDIGTDFTPDTGALFIIAPPVPGLKLGLDLGFGDAADNKPVYAAAYFNFAQEKLFSVTAGGKFTGKTAYVYDAAEDETVETTDATALTAATFGVSFNAVEGLTLAADALIDGLGSEYEAFDLSDLTLTTVSQVVGYDVTPALNVGVVAYQYIFGAGFDEFADGDLPFGYSIKPNVTYKVSDSISVAGEVKYEVGNTEANVGESLVANDAASLTVKPSATFTLTPNATIVTAFSYLKSLDDEWVSYGTTDKGDPIDSKIVVNVDFRYSF